MMPRSAGKERRLGGHCRVCQLARSIVLTTIAAVAAAGGYGLYTGKFGPVNAVWIVAGPIIGAVVSHYFGRHERKDSE